MNEVILGRTNIKVNKNGFGALPIQRVSKEDASKILMKAYENGINFYDTARYYSDSEEKIGYSLNEVRWNIIIATKTGAATANNFWTDLETSLSLLKTDHIDIYQFHNPSFCPKPGDQSELYEAMLKAREQGKIRFIGITNHRLDIAMEAISSGLYDTVQFPFSYLSSNKELELVNKCKEKNIGFIAMKALAGGLIVNSAAAYAYLNQFENVLPIWGIQKENELDEFILHMKNIPEMSDQIAKIIENDRAVLDGEFCRGCGYCMPCPADIVINWCARMSLLIRRSPSAGHLNEKTQEMMKKIDGCLHCGECVKKCPYEINTPSLLEKNYKDYKEILAGKEI